MKARVVMLLACVVVLVSSNPLEAKKKKVNLEPLTIHFSVDPAVVDIFLAELISQDPRESLERLQTMYRKKRTASGLTVVSTAAEADVVVTVVGLTAPFLLLRVETRGGQWATFAGIKGGNWRTAVDHVAWTARNWIVAHYDEILAAKQANG